MNPHAGLKCEYKGLKAIVGEIINEWDPMGLLGMGAPEDEYDSEINSIVAILRTSNNNADELAKGIQAILHESFDDRFLDARCFDKCLEAANNIRRLCAERRYL